jgi:hypothetical protein
MNTLRSFSVLAALSLTGAVCAQTPLDGASTVQRNGATHMAAASPGKVDSGMRVRSSSGDLLGTVASIIPSDSGKDAYVVIADLQGIATPVPYRAASAMVQHDMLVVDKSRFANAPKVQQYQTDDGPSVVWEKKADSYWKQAAATRSEDKSGVRHE